MGIQIPHRKKQALIPNSTTIIQQQQQNLHENSDDFKWFPFYFIIMIPNIIGTISKAISRHDYSLAIVCLSSFAGFFFLQLCLIKYTSLPKNEKSIVKFLLKLNMWYLYTTISFGFVYQFSEFFPAEITAALYGVVLVSSMFLFYVFIVVDLSGFMKIWRFNGEIENVTSVPENSPEKLPENRTLDAGKLNHYSIVIMEKV